MPRIAKPAQPRPDPAAFDAQHDPHDEDARPFVHKQGSVAESGVQRPPGVAASIFDAGRIAAVGWQAKPKRRVRVRDLAHVEIERGVEPRIGLRDQATKAYTDLLGRMSVGDSVVLTRAVGRRLYNVARRLGYTTRSNICDDPDMLRVRVTSRPAPGEARPKPGAAKAPAPQRKRAA